MADSPPSSDRPRSRALAFVMVCVCAVSWAAPSVTSAQPKDESEVSPWAHSRPEDLTIKLVTFGPGDDIFNYFGHNGMIVSDSAQQIAALYNFGMFHFGLAMLPNYMKGKLTFWVAETPVRATFAHYRSANRSIRVQELNLLPARRKQIADALALAVTPEKRDYLYDHFNNNCSTRLRDLVDEATDGQFHQFLDHSARMNDRQHIRRYAQKDPITDFALVFWMNDRMEEPIKQWDELFLPEELEQQVARMHYRDDEGHTVPLVATSYTVFESDRPPAPEWPNRGYPWPLALGIALGLAAWGAAYWTARTGNVWGRRLLGLQQTFFGLILGLPGLLGWLMWAFTEHLVTYRNENLMLSNPFTMLLFPLGIAVMFGSPRGLRWSRNICYLLAGMSLLLVALKLLPSFNQDTLMPMALYLPANIGYALAYRALARRPAAASSSMEARDGAVSRA
jgi:hypothetical protein